jgi:Pretoxin HINT domain/HEAT repeats
MVQLLLFCCVLVGDDGQSPNVSAKDRADYESAVRQAGKDPKAQTRLALWCEAHGLTAERARHLALAIATDPANVLARGLAGLVAHKGQWKPAEEIERESRNDPARQALIREYLERRARTPHTADAQLKLAAWCADNGLKEQALAHYTDVTRIDQARELAWKKLGYLKKGNRWVKPEDAAAQKTELERQKKADQQWKPRLEKLREGLESSSSARRDKAREGLAQVADPRAVPMVMKVFGTSSESMQVVAVGVLAQIEGPAASFWLASLAVDSPSAEVRRRAADALKRRDPHDVIGLLIGRVHKRYKYEVKPAQGPASSAALFVDGEQFDIRRFYQMPGIDVRLMPPVTLTAAELPQSAQSDPLGVRAATPVLVEGAVYLAAQRQGEIAVALAQNRNADLTMQQSIENDIRILDDLNAQIDQTNDRVLPLLQTLTGQDYGTDQLAWQKWWCDQLGLVLDSSSSSSPSTKPTLAETVTMPNTIAALSTVAVAVGPAHHSCFAAGTLVHSIDGTRQIESIQVGDLVLSQNTTSGGLSFQPVVAVHCNKPHPTLKLSFAGDEIVATGIHRFWKAGTGWTMARDLNVGDKLRMIGGVVSVQAIEPSATQPVYNLDVAQNRNFCVGEVGLLVHDFSFVEPALAPFDRPSEAVKLPALAGHDVPSSR